MKKHFLIFLIFGIIGTHVIAQNQKENDIFTVKSSPEPFLFSLSTLTPEDQKWSLDYSSSYGERVETPLGFEGVSQQLAVKGYLGKRFTVYANTALGFPQGNKVYTAQQAEVLRNIVGGKKYLGFRVGAGLGARRDFSNDFSLLGRATMEYMASRWKASGNLLFEKNLEEGGDAIDIITSLGFHYRLTDNFYGGFEAIGEDLEGFWDAEEAEGGAKLMLGPSLNLMPNESRFSFSLSGGPVFLATQNEISNPDAFRELPSQAGLMIRGKIIFKLG